MRRLRNESTILHMIRVAPWRRGAPKAQDGSPKRYERQWSGKGLVASYLNAIFGHRHHYSSLKSRAFIRNQRAIRPLGEPWTPKPLPFLKTLHEKTLDTAASNWYNNTRLSQEPVKRSPKERRKTSWQTKANVILSHKSHDRAANTDRSKAQMKTRPWKRFQKNIWQNEMNVVR